MPLFEYDCNDCGESFEALTSGERQPACPACATANLTRKLSAFAVGGRIGSRTIGSFRPRAGGGGSLRPQAGAGEGCGSCGDPRGPGACAVGES